MLQLMWIDWLVKAKEYEEKWRHKQMSGVDWVYNTSCPWIWGGEGGVEWVNAVGHIFISLGTRGLVYGVLLEVKTLNGIAENILCDLKRLEMIFTKYV